MGTNETLPLLDTPNPVDVDGDISPTFLQSWAIINSFHCFSSNKEREMNIPKTTNKPAPINTPTCVSISPTHT